MTAGTFTRAVGCLAAGALAGGLTLAGRAAAAGPASVPPPAAAPFDFQAYEAQREAARTAAGAAQAAYLEAKAALLAAAGHAAPGPLPAGQAYPAATLDAYLKAALALVDSGLQYQLASGQAMPLALTPASMQGWVKEWPGNPLDGWRPLRVVPGAAGKAAPGDLGWELCAPADYSWVQGRLEPRTYKLVVYSAAAGSAEPQALDAVQHAQAAYTAAPPAGTDPAQLRAQADEAAWIRDRAQAWAARWPADADPQLQAFLLRGMPEYLRSAHYVEQLRQALAATPQAQWADKQQTDYLQQALWLAYTGYNQYVWGGGAGDFWSAAPQAMPYWPGNPYADWQPMALRVAPPGGDGVNPGGAGHHPGDLYLDEAPLYYAQLASDGRLSRSYELYVFGATPHSTAPNLSLPDATKLWAGPPPPGVVGCLELSVTPQLSGEFTRAICHS